MTIPKHIELECGNIYGGITTTYIWEDGLTISLDNSQDYGINEHQSYAYAFHDWHEWRLDSDGSFTFRLFGRKEDTGEFIPVPQPWNGNPVYRLLKIFEAEYLATLRPRLFALQQRISGDEFELHGELFSTRAQAERQALEYLNAVLSWQNIEGFKPYQNLAHAEEYAHENDIAYVEITELYPA